jgi:hypothetical protein
MHTATITASRRTNQPGHRAQTFANTVPDLLAGYAAISHRKKQAIHSSSSAYTISATLLYNYKNFIYFLDIT